MAQEREPSNLAHWNRESSNLTLETETFYSALEKEPFIWQTGIKPSNLALEQRTFYFIWHWKRQPSNFAVEREPSNLAHWNREPSNMTLETENLLI